MSDPIRTAATRATEEALVAACEANGIVPPASITARLWAEMTLNNSLVKGALPSQDALTDMLKGVPPLFISDSNK